MLSQGDIIKVNFNPSLGHEQAGYRPACIISNRVLNNHANLYFCCPITHTQRITIFDHELVGYTEVDGFVLCDQLKSFDLSNRPYKVIGHLRESDLDIVLDKIDMIIEKE